MNYINVLYVQILIWDHDNFARVTWKPKYPFQGRFRQTSYKDFIFARGESLIVVGAQNETLRIILKYYMFEYWFGITTTDMNPGRLAPRPNIRTSTAADRLRFQEWKGGLNDATDGCDSPSDESVSNSHTHRFVKETNSSKRTKERIKCSNSQKFAF